jgi:hypothetical protein
VNVRASRPTDRNILVMERRTEGSSSTTNTIGAASLIATIVLRMRKHEENGLERLDAGAPSSRWKIHTVETLAENGALRRADFAWAHGERLGF